MRGSDRLVGFPFLFMEYDLGHNGSLRVLVGKLSPEYSTRSPFFVICRRYLAYKPARLREIMRFLSVLTWITTDGKRQAEATSSCG
uniref:Uncharacterized protein n=1 Tax=Solanum lycopersicum TaxID=4081 RepID=A0A3Q7HN10_SOLLC